MRRCCICHDGFDAYEGNSACDFLAVAFFFTRKKEVTGGGWGGGAMVHETRIRRTLQYVEVSSHEFKFPRGLKAFAEGPRKVEDCGVRR